LQIAAEPGETVERRDGKGENQLAQHRDHKPKACGRFQALVRKRSGSNRLVITAVLRVDAPCI
jgi:hypothetical protein